MLAVPTEKTVMLKLQLCYTLELKMFCFEIHFWSGKQKMIAHRQILRLTSRCLPILSNIMVASFCGLFELNPQSLVSGTFLWMMDVVPSNHQQKIHTLLDQKCYSLFPYDWDYSYAI